MPNDNTDIAEQEYSDTNDTLSSPLRKAFESLSSSLMSIHLDARKYDVAGWITKHMALVAATGTIAAVLPGSHLL